ncbi:MAG TPA: hypothetical protein VFL99_07635 [Segeticoccus sp.]|uniref:hypothetical protein n=1 Tax=Segeticoccus sp. TaxID=2706531 RepID=UPI002D804ACE|nr:hypothetical protein [Segeticoccus sp.]HET8600181.1 hypothetical protein [Segeticoccus sp.]
MYHHDPMFIEAEIAYRREPAIRNASRWEAERGHPVREAVRRWLTGLHEQTTVRRTATPAQPVPTQPTAARPEPVEPADPRATADAAGTAKERSFEHAGV